jgi:NAD(P)H-hydrate epimerase
VPKVVSVEEMKAIEKAADASGLTYDKMMENAGRAVADAVLERIGTPAGKRVAILVGSGNNGGDGLVVGHHLAQAGAQVSAYLAGARPEVDPHLAKLRTHGSLVANAGDDQRHRVLRNLMATADVVVDAILGTGFRLPLREEIHDVLALAKKTVEERRKPPLVVAVDCPSGMDCDTGQLAAETLPADLTVTLAAAKIGHFRFPGASAVGELVVADIGIPERQKELAAVQTEVADPRALRLWLPPRPPDAHKGTFGRSLIVAGSVNFPGAAGLAGMAAYRVGAGLVTLAVPSPIQGLIAGQIPEATWVLLPHELGVISEAAVEILRDELGSSQAILLGPGFGQDPATAAFVARLLGSGEGGSRSRIGFVRGEERKEESAALPPCVVDADGLKLLTRVDGWPSRLPRPAVLTPHPGEMSVLTGMGRDEIQADRVAVARRWAAEWGHVVVLKGAYTVIASPEGMSTIIPIASSALARAGTGDVLAGAIVGLMGQGVAAYGAAILGAYLHGRAGLIAAEAHGTPASVLAGEVADALPEALAELTAAGAS